MDKSHSHGLRFKRLRAMGRAVERLDRHIAQMEAQSKRLSNYRVATFLAGTALFFLPLPVARWIPVTGVGLFFLYWVVRHNKLHHRLQRYRIWRHIKHTDLARANVNWEDIPPASKVEVADTGMIARDLELVGEHSLQRLLDISISARGCQRLAEWLSQAVPDPQATILRQQMIRELTGSSYFRDRLRLIFHLTAREKLDDDKMTKWLSVPPPPLNVKMTLVASTLLLSLSLGIFLLLENSPSPPFWFLPYGMYVVLFFSSMGKLAPVLETAQWLDDELSVFNRILLFLERYRLKPDSHLVQAMSVFQTPGKRPSRKIFALKTSAACIGLRNNPIMAFLLNIVFPWDLLFAHWTLVQREKLKEDFPIWLHTLSELEAMNSLANFAHINPDYSFPIVRQVDEGRGPIFSAKALGHPLIDPAIRVTNAYSIEKVGEITLVTGSNMAGKSTFLKTVGINLILAYCGGPVNAESLHTCFFRVCTCIKIEDSLADGISTFYAEVRRLRQILTQIRQTDGPPVIFLIDEILRGTNNRERLIGSGAIVRALTKTFSAGLISTHDLELTPLSAEHKEISNYHFAETIKEDKMFFSYQLRRGPCPTTNALHIMRKEGLPIPTSDYDTSKKAT